MNKLSTGITAGKEFEFYERRMTELHSRIGTDFRQFCADVAAIKEFEYYKQAGYETFAECCEQRWGWKSSRGRQLTSAHAFLKELPEEFVTVVTNESQVRQLKALPAAVLHKVVRQAVRTKDLSKPLAKARRQSRREPIEDAEEVVIDMGSGDARCAECAAKDRHILILESRLMAMQQGRYPIDESDIEYEIM